MTPKLKSSLASRVTEPDRLRFNSEQDCIDFCAQAVKNSRDWLIRQDLGSVQDYLEGFIGKKEKRVRPDDDQNLGVCYTLVAIERHPSPHPGHQHHRAQQQPALPAVSARRIGERA